MSEFVVCVFIVGEYGERKILFVVNGVQVSIIEVNRSGEFMHVVDLDKDCRDNEKRRQEEKQRDTHA
jgi:hypothetical protein